MYLPDLSHRRYRETQGKNPDGISLVPWSKGNLSDTLAPSYLVNPSAKPGLIAALATSRKHRTYQHIKDQNFILIAIACETLSA